MASTLELLLLAQASGKPQESSLTYTTGTQAFTTTSSTGITGLAPSLGIGTYFLDSAIYWHPSGTIGSTHNHGLTYSGTVSSCGLNLVCYQAETSNAVQQNTNFDVTALAATMVVSPAHANFGGWTTMQGYITTSTAGTLSSVISLGTAGDDVQTYPGSFLHLVQVS